VQAQDFSKLLGREQRRNLGAIELAGNKIAHAGHILAA